MTAGAPRVDSPRGGPAVAAPRFLALGVAMLGMAGCGGASPVHTDPRPTPEWALTVRVLPADSSIEVSGTLRLPAGRTRKDLGFALSERMSKLRVEVVEPLGSAGPVQLTLAAMPVGARVEGERRNARWVLRPPRSIPPGDPVVLRFSFVGRGEPGFLYAVGPEVAFASGWGDPWYPRIDDASGVATGELTVVVPAGWTTATGATRESRADEEARGVFRFAYRSPTYFTFVAGPYTVVRREGAVPISAYLLTRRNHIDSWQAGAESMLGALGAEFGPYPFEELVLAEVPRALAIRAGFNAFSPAGMLVLNSRAFDAPDVKYLLEWLGHEMGHQWFPHAVTWDPPGFLYLEEALAEYGGLRVVETMAGPDAARRMRTAGFEYDPIYSAAAWFRQLGAGQDRPLAELRPGLEDRNLAYNKGSLVLDMLSREIGRATFQRILGDLTRGRRFHTITWEEFLRAVAAGSGRDVGWFFTQWLERAGAPDFSLSWIQVGDSVRGTITQPAPHYRAHLKVEIRGSDGQRLAHIVEIVGARAAFALNAGFRARDVLLDPDYEVLRWTPEYRALADSTRTARRAPH